MSWRRWKRVLWCVGALLAALALVKSFVADVYLVETGSMRPTIFGGRERPDEPEDSEHVLVRYARGFRPERFDLVVMNARDDGPPIVKRVAGLPGEELAIRDGDLFVSGARLPPGSPRPTLVCLFDSRWQDLQALFEFRRDGSVSPSGDEWIMRGAEPVELGYHPRLTDGYLDRHHRPVPGLREVNDGALRLECRLEEPAADVDLRLFLVEAGDSFEVELSTRTHALRLVRRVPRALAQSSADPGEEIELARVPVELPPGRWFDLAFSNVDDQLLLRSSALGLHVRSGYAGNRPCPAGTDVESGSVGPRVGFEISGGVVRVRSVRVLRDLYYTEAGTYGTTAPIRLGPDEYFLLGDNSAASTDSRHFGPVRAHELIGIPVAVVAPRPRWLEPVGEP